MPADRPPHPHRHRSPARTLAARGLLSGLVALAAACGDDGPPPLDAALDSGSADTGPDALADGDLPDATVPEPDAGPPPPCALAASYVTLAPAFDGSRDEDPGDFTAVTPEGPWAFAYRADSGGGPTRESLLEVRLVDGAGTEAGLAELASATGDRESLANVRIRPAGGGLLAVWARTTLDDMGRITESEVHHAGIAEDGTVSRADAVLYDTAAAPFLVSDPPDDAWVLRSDITLTGMVTGIAPRIQHLTGAGAPDGPDVDLGSYLRVEATEVLLRRATGGLKLVFRVPPSTAFVVPLADNGTPMRPERMTPGVPFIDDVATADDRIAAVWTETVGGTASLGLILLDGEGSLVQRVALESFEATYLSRIAVVPAWPGFVAIWRTGTGPDAVLRAAGITTSGTLRVPAADLVATPEAGGELFAVTNGAELALGSRARPMGMPNTLALARACIPR